MSTPLPEMFEGELDDAQLAAYFADLELVGPVEVRTKGAARELTAEVAASLDLDAARAQLQSGAARMLQLRYRHDGSDWWDTLIAGAVTTRLVRVRHDFDQPR